MSLFEAKVSDYSRAFISGMNILEANRTSIELVERLSEILRDAGIANHPHVCIHDHYTPAQLGMWVRLYCNEDGLRRIVELLHGFAATNKGVLSVKPEGQESCFTLLVEGVHDISFEFASSSITRDHLDFALGEWGGA